MTNKDQNLQRSGHIFLLPLFDMAAFRQTIAMVSTELFVD